MEYTDEKYNWNLKDIFANEEERQNAISKFEEYIEVVKSFKGKLNNLENIKRFYEIKVEASELHIKIHSYAMLTYHLNMGDANGSKMYKDAVALGAKYATAVSFSVPELLQNSKEELESFANHPEMKEYKRRLEKIIREKDHILSQDTEKALSAYAEVFDAVENAYDVFTTTDFIFNDIKDSNGNLCQMSHGLYSKYLSGQDRLLRKNAFEEMYRNYKENINTITELYLARVKDMVITAKLRNYKNSIDMASQNDGSKEDVYYCLIDSVNRNLNLNHEYLELKKKTLQNELDDGNMHMYDVYRNNIQEEDKHIEYEDAKQIVLNALSIMGQEYVNLLKTAMDNRWIDVAEKENKMTGAYSLGVYGVHPYVLLNYIKSSRDVSTIAHELGHSMHSYFAAKNQNVLNESYTIMVAEVASTVNELLLANYQISKEEDNKEKAYLINEQLDMIRATLFRQAMFAEFEKTVHERIEFGESLASEDLNNIYFELVKKYFGDTTICDESIKYEWARIPHFYSNFYVYKYSTGITAAIVIASKIISGEEGFVEKYINMLSKGGAEDSLDLLKSVGVDLEKPETYDIAFNFFKEKMNELKELI